MPQFILDDLYILNVCLYDNHILYSYAKLDKYYHVYKQYDILLSTGLCYRNVYMPMIQEQFELSLEDIGDGTESPYGLIEQIDIAGKSLADCIYDKDIIKAIWQNDICDNFDTLQIVHTSSFRSRTKSAANKID